MDLMTGDYITIDRELVCNTIVYFREANGKRLFVIINNSESVVQYTLDVRYCKKVNPARASRQAWLWRVYKWKNIHA